MFNTKARQSTCPDCHSPVEEHLDFCHACGETLPKATAAPRRQRRLSFVFAAASILTVAIAIIIGLTIYDFVQQYGVPGAADVAARAGRYLSEGRSESAINLLEESLQVKPADENAAQWRIMLDRALFERGKKLVAEGKYRDAVTAFARISHDFAKHEEVEKLISEYGQKGLPVVLGRGEESETVIDKGKRPLSRLEKAVMTAVPGGKQHVDPLPSSIRQPVPAPLPGALPEQPGRQ